jgi:hypothetical protein
MGEDLPKKNDKIIEDYLDSEIVNKIFSEYDEFLNLYQKYRNYDYAEAVVLFAIYKKEK